MGPRAGRIRHVAASRSGLAVDRLLRLFDAAQWSGLLCRALTGTGLAGAPAEYFNATFRSPLSLRWGTGNDLHAHVRALRANRTSSDGVFGAKLHWDQLEQVRKELRHPVPREAALEILQGWFPGAAYVSIEREDVNRQAVSLWTALRTDVWSVSTSASSPAPPRVPYSYSGIHRQRESIVRGRDAWETAFARTRIETIRVVYEELTGDFQQTVARVLEMATGQRIAAGDVPPPESRRLAGERSEELLRRFESDPAATPSQRARRAHCAPAALEAFDDGGDRLAEADTHRRDAVTRVPPVELVDQRRGHAGSRCAQRMAE